ncbi:MAG TPA: hypothetical protein PLH82_00450 [Candidatus Paceibacterota bacterium]|nr:hypothetical protein [Candidatus Paceibacterota bacterium]HRU35753.1 hypothetical protein [Candidatus Paceibacterota bacterium]
MKIIGSLAPVRRSFNEGGKQTMRIETLSGIAALQAAIKNRTLPRFSSPTLLRILNFSDFFEFPLEFFYCWSSQLLKDFQLANSHFYLKILFCIPASQSLILLIILPKNYFL